MNHFERLHTAKAYRSIRSEMKRLLTGNPEEIERDRTSNEHIYSAFVLGICMFLAMIILIIFSCKANAQEINLDKIGMIESSNEPLAYNKSSGAVGEYQLTTGVVREYNEYHSNFMYNLDDMYISGYAMAVANWYLNDRIPVYLKYYKIPDTITSRLICYNWGVGHFRKWFNHGSHWNHLPFETQNYIKRYFHDND